ncbi:MAG: TrmB family transcriptional regulator [Desulfobacterales bacterium]|nr:TrmB family transcriptional regulator [Desulfobacterales bacterium]
MAQTPLSTLGLSQSELKTYMALLQHAPANGSQLSRHSGVPRANIYNILEALKRNGMVAELQGGLYTPLPTDEFMGRMRRRVDADLAALEKQINAATKRPSTETIWTLKGYDDVIAKAKEMIDAAKDELYVLLYPPEARHLDDHLVNAEKRGVDVKYVSMGPPLTPFKYQVVHPGTQQVQTAHAGRVIDVVRDKTEILVGMFEAGREDQSPINWARNHWFVMALRETIRHDFFHYLIYKILDLGEELNEDDKTLYGAIQKDAWANAENVGGTTGKRGI